MSSEGDFYSKSGLGIFLFAFFGSLAFFAYIAFIHPGVVGLDKVADVEKEKAVEATQAAQPKVKAVDPESVEKPWVYTPEMAEAGKKPYKMNCALCHGETGLADGPASNPQTRNLVKGPWKAGGTSVALYKTLQNGLEGTGMVSFKASVSPKARWAIVHYIRSITKDKPEDDAAELEAFAKTAD